MLHTRVISTVARLNCFLSELLLLISPWPSLKHTHSPQPTDTVLGVPADANRFRNTRRSSCQTGNKALKCSVCKVTWDWCWFCWVSVWTWMSSLKGEDSVLAGHFRFLGFGTSVMIPCVSWNIEASQGTPDLPRPKLDSTASSLLSFLISAEKTHTQH